MANIKDVARLANVGIATVSRVTNNTGNVSEKTRKKVLAAMEELSFTPNAMGRSLKTQKSMIVGFVVPDIAQIVFSKLAYYVAIELEKSGYILATCNSHGDAQRELAFVDLVLQNRLDGLILIGDNNLTSSIIDMETLVTVDTKVHGNIPCISTDNSKGGILAANYLINCGAKNLGFIGPKLSVDSNVDCRWHSFCTICTVNNLPYVCDLFEYGHGDELQAAQNFLDKNPDLDGIFAASDDLAYCLLEILKSKGKRVPEDVQLIGYDGAFIDSHLPIAQITTIACDFAVFGKTLAETIVKKINKEVLDNIPYVPVTLYEGFSTK